MIVSLQLAETVKGILLPVQQLSPRREIVAILLIIAEAMVVYLYAGFLLGTYAEPHYPVSLLLIISLMLIAYHTPHLLETMRIWTPLYELIMTATLVTTLLILIKTGSFSHHSLFSAAWIEQSIGELTLRGGDAERPVWGLVVLTIYAWWRGRMRAEPVLDTAYTLLRWGIVLAGGGAVLAWLAAPPDAIILQTASPALVGFLMFALLSIAVARQPVGEDSSGVHAAWIWAAIFIAPILAIVLTTVSTAGILSRDLLDLIVSVLKPGVWLLGLLLRSLILVIALIAFVIIAPILWLLERHDFGQMSGLPRIDLAPRTPGEFGEFSRSTLEIGDPLRYLIVGVILILVTYYLVRFAFKRRKYWQEPSLTQRESLIHWGEEPASLLERAGKWLRRRFSERPRDDLPAGTQWVHTRRIRRIYRSFLRNLRSRGVEREQGQTPNALASKVSALQQNVEQPVRELTSQYNETRYSGRPATPDRAERAETALADIKRRLDSSGSR